MELLAQWINEYGDTWKIKKMVTEDAVTITTEATVRERPTELVSEYCYRNLLPEYKSPFLSWKNLIFCSNNCGVSPHYDYMNSAVQSGQKTAATIYLKPQTPEAQEFIQSLPSDCDVLIYDETMLFVFHRGCLADFFSLASIKEVYEAHGVFSIDWSWIAEQFKKPLSHFADAERCGFNLQSGGNGGECLLTGLILGYPIESTMLSLGGDCDWQERISWVKLPQDPPRLVK